MGRLLLLPCSLHWKLYWLILPVLRFAKWTPRPKIIFRESEPNFFDLLHSSWAQKHCSTYKLVWKSMKPNREICIIAHRAITERVALLDSGILLFKAYEGKMAISACCMACRHIDITLHTN